MCFAKLIGVELQGFLSIFVAYTLTLQADNPRPALNEDPLLRPNFVSIFFVVDFRDRGSRSLKLHSRQHPFESQGPATLTQRNPSSRRCSRRLRSPSGWYSAIDTILSLQLP